MKKNSITAWIAFLTLVLVGQTAAQSGGPGAEQQEVDQMLEMMKQQGMDPQQLEQMENMFRDMADMATQQKAAQADQERRTFEDETAGHGTATIQVEGKQYDLKVTRCEVKSGKQGIFTIQARQAPGMEDGELAIYSDGAHRQQSVNFSIRTRPSTNYTARISGLVLDGKVLSWQGQVESNQRELPMTLSLKCGAEAVFYDVASRERPAAADNVLTLYLGAETYTFETGRCSTEPYRSGNWEFVFEATATGRFRGQPAILLLESGREVAGTESEGAGESHGLELLLGEITPQQRQLSPHALKQQLSEKVVTYQGQQLAAHEKKYGKAYWDKVSPTDMVAAMNASTAEMDAIMAQADAMRFPSANSHEGMTTVDGQNILFRGPPMRTSDADRAPVFRELNAIPEVFVTCGT